MEDLAEVECRLVQDLQGDIRFRRGCFECPSFNLFVTSKNETANSPSHQFTNLKCCKKAREPFKTLF